MEKNLIWTVWNCGWYFKEVFFIQELAKVNHTLKNEVNMKDKLGKEKETLQTELISLKDKLRESNVSAEEAKRKLTNAESQLVDLTAQGLDTTDVRINMISLLICLGVGS